LRGIGVRTPRSIVVAIALLILILVISAIAWSLRIQLYTTRAPFSAFLILIVLLVAGYVFMEQAKLGKSFPVRKIPAFDAIEEAIARSVEMGRPVHMTFGFGTISSSMAPPST